MFCFNSHFRGIAENGFEEGTLINSWNSERGENKAETGAGEERK